MAIYKYKAQKEDGTKVSGTMPAENEQELHERLKHDELFLLEAKEAKEINQFQPLKTKQVSEFCRQIGTFIASGIPMLKALKMIAEEESISDHERKVFLSLLEDVRKGMMLSDAMERQQEVFPKLLINMFKSAEASGQVDKTALQMAKYYEKEYKLNNKVKNSLMYPKILSVIILLVVIVLMVFVMPEFEPLFARLDRLPATTSILMGISSVIKEKWLTLLIVLAIVYMVGKLLMGIPKVKLLRDRGKVHAPMFGNLQKTIYTARFARTLSSLHLAGIPVITILQIAKKTVGNTYIEQQFEQVIHDVRTGVPLSSALQNVDGFTNKMIASIRVGEETGKLDDMLESTAENLDYEAEQAVARMVSYIEPLMIIIMAFIVGFVMLAVMQAIYSSYGAIG